MEQTYSITTVDRKRIYGVAHIPKIKTTSAVIIVHGLTGHMNEFLHLTVARFLAAQNIAVFRFNQYDDLEGARRFHETTISLHVADTQQVVSYVRDHGFTKIALIGHSLGAPVSISAADKAISALLLWDPTGAPAERILEWDTYDQKHQLSYLDWEKRIILGDAWIADAKSFPDPFEKIAQLTIPVKIIAAAQGGKMEHCERYQQALSGKAAFEQIKNAGHCFTEEGAIEQLSHQSLEWLKNHL